MLRPSPLFLVGRWFFSVDRRWKFFCVHPKGTRRRVLEGGYLLSWRSTLRFRYESTLALLLTVLLTRLLIKLRCGFYLLHILYCRQSSYLSGCFHALSWVTDRYSGRIFLVRYLRGTAHWCWECMWLLCFRGWIRGPAAFFYLLRFWCQNL